MKVRTHIIGFIIGFGLIWALLPQPAAANGGPHGDYAPTTDACAGCHRTHTAPAAKILVRSGSDLCYTCHGTGMGASTGRIISAHGNTDFGARAEAPFALQCAQCHDPHGSPNLHLVKTQVDLAAGLTAGPITLTASSGLHSYDDGVSPMNTRLCTACHADANNPGYPMTNHVGGAGHASGDDFSASNCIYCHPHSADLTQNNVDGFMPVNGCLGCHQFPQDNGDGVPIGGRRAIIPEFGKTSHHAQGILEEADCLSCHYNIDHQSGYVKLNNVDNPAGVIVLNGNPRTDPTEAAKLEPFCLACHDANGAAGLPPFTDGLMPPIVDGMDWSLASHQSNYTCFSCHDNGHGSNKIKLLAPWDAVPDAGFPADPMRQEEGQCYQCHGPAGPATVDVLAHFERFTHHNISALEQVDGSRVECVNCHNPHTANPTHLLANPDDRSKWLGTDGNFCLRCHDGGAPLGVAFPASSPGTGNNKAAYPGTTHETLLGGYSCRHCHDGHGSSFRATLLAQYIVTDYNPSTAGDGDYAICWTCHNENSTMGNGSRFGNLHNLHVRGERSSCITCHDVHAPYDSGEHGLINFEFAVRNGFDFSYRPGYNASTAYQINAAGNQGSCYLSCHGKNHNPESYTRRAVVPVINCTACHPGGPPIAIPRLTFLPTPTMTVTPTVALTPTVTSTGTMTPTATPTITATDTLTNSVPTITVTGTIGAIRMTPTATVGWSPTPTATPTLPWETAVPQPTSTPTATAVLPTAVFTPEATPTILPTLTP
ncbi:MAG: hypothetical protein KA362_01490 [Chloroflexi bacterium]|nr:hypothetical protein [Chloroflexota bacterium]MBP6802757.1 hypothetical protein [Chloroflexota bacterium]